MGHTTLRETQLPIGHSAVTLPIAPIADKKGADLFSWREYNSAAYLMCIQIKNKR